MTSSKTVASSVVWTLVRSWGARLAGFVIYFQLVRLLNPAEMGLYAAAFAAIAFLELFADQGLTISLVQRKEVSNALINAAFLFNVVSSLLLIVGIWFAAPLLEQVLSIAGFADVLRVCSLTLAISALGFCQDALARRTFQFKKLALRSMAATILSGLLGVYMAWQGHGVWALVGQLLAATVINTAVLWYKAPWWPGRELDLSGALQLIKFGFRVLGIRISEYLNTRGLEFLFALLFGAVSLGFYSVGSKLYFILSTLLGSAIVEVAYSVFSRLAGDDERMRKAYAVAVSLTTTVGFPCWVLLSAASADVVLFAFGPKWQASADVLTILGIVGALQMIQRYDVAVMTSKGRPGQSLKLSFARTVVCVALALAVSGSGMQASVLAYLAGQLVLFPASAIIVGRQIGMTQARILSLYAPQLGAAALMWMLTHYLTAHAHINSVYARLPAVAAAGMAMYVLALFVIDRQKLLSIKMQLNFLRKGQN